MKKLKEGDTGQAICKDCSSLSNITYRVRNVPFSDGSGIVKNILVGVCNCCDRVISVPHQSTPEIKKEFEKTAIKRHSHE
ncbi:MAG: hypothetical protein ACPGR2_01915 [Psychrobium sp.]